MVRGEVGGTIACLSRIGILLHRSIRLNHTGAKDGRVGIGPHGDVLSKAAGSLLRRWGFDTSLAVGVLVLPPRPHCGREGGLGWLFDGSMVCKSE